MSTEFEHFPKIYRFSREVIVTEKIDGTNAQVLIADDGQVLAGSKNRWITPEDDNFGFASWVKANEDELRKLGPGRHFGEWWGSGIQRRYGLAEKRFSLSNVSRWHGNPDRPSCCHTVPILWRGMFHDLRIDNVLASLESSGSIAAPGFMKPEGVVIFHIASGSLFKKTIGNDGAKGGHR